MHKLVDKTGHVAMYGRFSVLEDVKDSWAKQWPEFQLEIIEAN